MKAVVPIVVAGMLSACHTGAATNSTALVQVDSRDFGDTNSLMSIVELERKEKTSTLKLTYRKLGASVGSSLFIARGFYEVAKARGAEYFINLKEWDDPNGDRIFIAGFTNTKDADVKQEFGEEFEYETEYHQQRGDLSVAQCKLLFERQEKRIDQSTPANGTSPRR